MLASKQFFRIISAKPLQSMPKYFFGVNVRDVRSEQDFQKFVKNADKPVIVKFFEESCGVCTKLGSMFEKKVGDSNGNWDLVNIDIKDNKALAQKYHVDKVPHVFLYNKGQAEEDFLGAKESELDSIINKADSLNKDSKFDQSKDFIESSKTEKMSDRMASEYSPKTILSSVAGSFTGQSVMDSQKYEKKDKQGNILDEFKNKDKKNSQSLADNQSDAQKKMGIERESSKQKDQNKLHKKMIDDADKFKDTMNLKSDQLTKDNKFKQSNEAENYMGFKESDSAKNYNPDDLKDQYAANMDKKSTL